MLVKFLKFVLKFLIFALVWTYMGRVVGMVYLIIWIALALIKERNKNSSRPIGFGVLMKERKYERFLPEYY